MRFKTRITAGAIATVMGLELLVTGCTPQATPVPTPTAAVEQAGPQVTPEATLVPEPTYTQTPTEVPSPTATPQPTQNPFEAAAEDYITNPNDPAAKKKLEGKILDILDRELEKDTVVKSFDGEQYKVDTRSPYGIPRGEGYVAEQEERLVLRSGSSLIVRMKAPVPYTPLTEQNLKVMPPIFGVTLRLNLSDDITQVLGYAITATPEGAAKGAGSTDMYERVELALKADAPLRETDFFPFQRFSLWGGLYWNINTFDDTLPKLPIEQSVSYKVFKWPGSELGTSNDLNNKVAKMFGPGFRNSNVEGVKIVQSIKGGWYEIWLGEDFARQPTGLGGADYKDFIMQKISEYSADKLASIRPVFDEETGLVSKLLVVTEKPLPVGEFEHASGAIAGTLESRIAGAMQKASLQGNYSLKPIPNLISDPRPEERNSYFEVTIRAPDGNFSKTLLTRALDEAVRAWAEDSVTNLSAPYVLTVSPKLRESGLSGDTWSYKLTFRVVAFPHFQPFLDDVASLGAFE